MAHPRISTVRRAEAQPEVIGASASRTIVIYGDGTGNFASVHDIDKQGIVGPGTWLDSKAFLHEVDCLHRPKKAEAREKAEQPVWLPYTILAASTSCLIWHVPHGYRDLRFTEPRMAALSGRYHVPGLVFKADSSKRIEVYAVKGKASPSIKAPLCEAPFPNLYTGGKVCTGSMPTYGCAPTDAEKWTESFFGSAFSHYTYFKYWTARKAGKNPALKPTKQTIEDLLS